VSIIVKEMIEKRNRKITRKKEEIREKSLSRIQMTGLIVVANK
jgi:hypothetical protein